MVSNASLRRMLALSFLPFAALADLEESEPELLGMLGSEEMVSIATGLEQPIQTAPAVASVITAQQIKDSGSRDVLDILRLVPGVHVGPSPISDPVISVRGFISILNQNILWLVDGVPQTNLVFSERRHTLGRIPLDMIDRVEVIRGPGSALYGSDAFMMTVNVITKRDNPERVSVTASYGSDDTRDLRGVATGELGGVRLVGGFEYFDTDGYTANIDEDLQSTFDATMGTHASVAPDNAYTERKEMGAHLNIVGENTTLSLRGSAWKDIGTFVGPASSLNPEGSFDHYTLEASLFDARSFGEDLDVRTTLNWMRYSYEREDIAYIRPGAFFIYENGAFLSSKTHEDFLRGSVHLDFKHFENHVLTLGAGRENSELTQDGETRNYQVLDNGFILPTPERDTKDDPWLGQNSIDRKITYGLVQDQWQFANDWALTLGVRMDHYSDVGYQTSPRGVLVWNATPRATWKLLYGRGFRAPSILEREAKQIPFLTGNENLNSDKIDSFDLAFDYRLPNDGYLRANAFYQIIEDRIAFQNAGGNVGTPENVGKQKGRGIELEGRYQFLPWLAAQGYYYWQHNEDRTINKDSGWSPHHKAFGMLEIRPTRKAYLNLMVTHVGDRDRFAVDDLDDDPDKYTFFNVLGRYQLTEHLEASLDVRNIFDNRRKEVRPGTSFPDDIPLPGRTFYFSLGGHF